MDRPGSIVEATREDSYLVSIMNDDPPQPKISFLRTKRFWFRRAVPGLLLVLWVEGVLFVQSFEMPRSTSSAATVHYLGLGEGNLCLASYSINTKRGATGLNGWNYSAFNFKFSWSPGMKLFPPFYRESESAEQLGIIITTRIFQFPLWLPLVLWLLAAHLWSRHLKRKQAELP